MEHPLHLAIGTFLRQLSIPRDCELYLASECGGNQNLPLFCGVQKGNDTEYCNPDVLLLRDNQVQAIMEIEESGFSPTKTCGKFLTAALSKYFIHDNCGGAIPIHHYATFIQVMDSRTLSRQKMLQGRLLQTSIQRILPIGGITEYRLLFFDGTAGFTADEQGRSELEKVIVAACSPLPRAAVAP